MTFRTSQKTVTFTRPFSLHGLDESLPAGDYLVETDEKMVEEVSFTAYRRVSTLLHLHANPRRPGFSQVLKVDPEELDAALLRDRSFATADDIKTDGAPSS